MRHLAIRSRLTAIAAPMISLMLISCNDKNDAGPNKSDVNIFDAIFSCDSQRLEHMLKGDGKPDLMNRPGGDYNIPLPPLHYACIYGNSNIVSLLLRHGASATVYDKEGFLPIERAINSSKDVEIGPLLEKYAPTISRDDLTNYLVELHISDRIRASNTFTNFSRIMIDGKNAPLSLVNKIKALGILSLDGKYRIEVDHVSTDQDEILLRFRYISEKSDFLSGGGELVTFKKKYGFWLPVLVDAYLE